MKKFLLSLFAPLGLFAADGDLLNGDFETVDGSGRAVDWAYESKYFRVDRAGGRNGTSGMLFDNRGDGCGSPLLQRVRVRPGMKYMFGAWIKPDKLEGKGFGGRICILWEDKYGRSLDGYYISGHIRGGGDWRLSEGTTTKAPPTAMWATVRPEIVAPISGRAWIDDVFFAPADTRPVIGLFSSAYRGEVASGDVVFAAALSPVANPSVTHETCRAVFSWTGPDGKEHTSEAEHVEAQMAKLTIPVSELKDGESTVVFRMIGKADGVEYWREETKIRRVGALRKRRVTFDQRGRTYIDGKPFFPLGMYWSVAKKYHQFKLPNINATSIVTYAESPFNCVMPYAGLSPEQLDICQRHGIKVIYPLLNDFSGNDWDPTGKDPARAYPKAAYRHIKSYKSHPALLAWYLNDERSVREIVNLRGRQRVAEALDDDHPSWICLYQFDQVAEYMGTFDCVGTDPYPVGGSPLCRAYEWADATKRGTMGVRPMWQVVQAFDWSIFRGKPQETDRMPTREEMKSMAWQAIAGGANGLIFYSYTYLMANPKVPFDKAWSDVKAVAEEVNDSLDILLSDGEPPRVESGNAQVRVRSWRDGDKRYVLAVNLKKEPSKSLIAIDGGAKDLRLRAGTAEYKVKNDKIGIGLGSDGYVVFEVR